MILKRTIASAVSAACILASGVLPSAVSAQALGESNWLDLTLQVSDNIVEPGDKLEVTVRARSFNGASEIGGLQLKLNDRYSSPILPEGLKLVEIKQNSDHLAAKETAFNPGTSEAALFSGSVKLDESVTVPVVTYVYQVPENVISGTQYLFSIDAGFTYFCDTDGNEIEYEYNFANAMVEITDSGAQAPKNVLLTPVISSSSLKQGDEFTLYVKASGSGIYDASGFQFKLNVPEGLECLGLVSDTISNGTELEFNPETLEVATADKKGNAVGFVWDEAIVQVKFRVPESFNDGVYSIGISDAFVSDGDGVQIAVLTGSSGELMIGESPVSSDPTGKLGDANLDGSVDAKDASTVLVEYSSLSTGNDPSLSEQQQANADVNFDGRIDSKDASNILAYYAYLSTGGDEQMEDWVKSNR